jgi:serine/threonine protein kinase
MEYVDGASLQEIVARHGTISPDRVAQYMLQAAHGLQHAHELGMVHRDVKPGNVLLDRSGVVKVLDMGLARFFAQTSDNVTERFDANCVLGTADYLAPEQAMSNVVDIRADLYALGGTMYYCLTGQSPFPDGTVAQKLVSHQTKAPKPVADFRSDVPPGLLAVLARMMHKDPAARPQLPAELANELAPWAGPPEPPPSNEMPDLCPAVRALITPGVEKVRSAAVARVGRVEPKSGYGGSNSSVRLAPASDPPTPPVSSGDGTPQAQVRTGLTFDTAPLVGRPRPEISESEIDWQKPAVDRTAVTAALPSDRESHRRGVFVGVVAGLAGAAAVAGLTALGVWLAR